VSGPRTDQEEDTAKLAATIRHAFKLRRKNSHRKTSLDNLVSAVLSDYLHFSAHRM